MAYVDYTYYKDTYLGILTESQFNKYEKKAELILNQATFNNINEDTIITINIKDCLCELTDVIYNKETCTDNKNIKSESVSDYSVSYADKTDITKEFKNDINDIILLYLDNNDTHNLLYRGVL